MEINIFTQEVHIDKQTKKYIGTKIESVIKKYFLHTIWAKIHFNKVSYKIHCDINIQEGSGHHYTIKSDGLSEDIHSCFDIALVKLEKQLRKYKSKLKNRHGKLRASEVLNTKKFIIAPTEIENEENDEKANEASISNNPVIIAEHTTQISTLSVDKAVMIMDLSDLPAILFKNSQTGRINMLYYKKCGNIAWVDTPE